MLRDAKVAPTLVLPALLAGLAWAAPPGSQSAPQEVSFTTDDGVVIAADYYAPQVRRGLRAPMVILLHMYQSDRSAWGPLMPHLRAAGMAILAIDLRGHGGSIEPRAFQLRERVADRDSKLFRATYRDVAAACVWMAAQEEVDPARFALVGAGMGASVALDYAARDKSVDAVACLSPATNDLGLDSVAAVRNYGARPVLLVASGAEADAAEQLRRAARQATVKLIGGPAGSDPAALHGTQMLGRAGGLEQLLVAFVEKSLGQATNEPVVASINSDVYHVPGTSHAQRIKDENRRWFSSAAEAESRGLRPVKTRTSRKKTESSAPERSPPPSAGRAGRSAVR